MKRKITFKHRPGYTIVPGVRRMTSEELKLFGFDPITGIQQEKGWTDRVSMGKNWKQGSVKIWEHKVLDRYYFGDEWKEIR